MKLIASVLVALLIPLGCLSEPLALLAGWRAPNSAETAQAWRKEDPHQYLVVQADFNGDGMRDDARLLLRDSGPAFGLFAFVSQKDGTYKTYVLDEVAAPHDIEPLGIMEAPSYIEFTGITAVPPGSYVTACGKGYGDCQDREPDAILLRHPGIDYFKQESANSYFYWDEATETFKRVWISD